MGNPDSALMWLLVLHKLPQWMIASACAMPMLSVAIGPLKVMRDSACFSKSAKKWTRSLVPHVSMEKENVPLTQVFLYAAVLK